MKTVELRYLAEAFIWAPLALAGTDLALQENLLIRIADGKISSQQSISREALPSPVTGHAHFYCLEDGLTLLPSLIDAHVHLALDGESGGLPGEASAVEDGGESDGVTLPPGTQQVLDTFLQCGIAAVRDGGDRHARNTLIKRAAARGPLIISTGRALRRQGSYGSFLGDGYSSARELPELLGRMIASGADQIKVLLSGIVSFKEYGRVEPPAIPPEDLRLIVSFAHRNGIRVMAHASSDHSVDLAVCAGVDSIEHGYFLSRASMEMMACRQIAWVPTLIPVFAQVREPMVNRWNLQEIEVITRTYEEHLAKLSLANRLGVPIGLGTDSGASGVKHGLDLAEEMLLYSRGQLSNKEVLHSAITVNAVTLGLEKRLGSLSLNREPFLMAVKGNPLADLQSLRRIEWIFLP